MTSFGFFGDLNFYLVDGETEEGAGLVSLRHSMTERMSSVEISLFKPLKKSVKGGLRKFHYNDY